MRSRTEIDSSWVADECGRAYMGGSRVIANKGGTRSGKTFGVLIYLLSIAWTRRVLISVVSESFPHLKRGAIRDFTHILESNGLKEDNHYLLNRTDNSYHFPHSGGRIEFFSADNAGKVHGAQRDILFINECNHLEWEIYRQLAVRTAQTIFLDWNPTSAFWFDERLQDRPNTFLIKSTYLDNPFLTPAQIAEIESNKGDENWWRVYGLGENGHVEGLVYSNWSMCNALPTTYKMEFYCLDFGFTNDPTAILRVRLHEGDLWIDELCYSQGLTNPDIVRVLQGAQVPRNALIVADSSEPKSIAEINAIGGYNAKPCVKGQGSIMAGISLVSRYKLHITQRSLGTINELRNYMWKTTPNGGGFSNVPVDRYNHALDALRYGCSTFLWERKQLKQPRMHYRRICEPD